MAVSSTTSTGINVPEIVTGLMDVERVPLNKLQTQVDEKTLVISTLGVFKSKVSALESAAKALTTPGIYALRDATSSDTIKVSATASNSAAAATYAVKVAQTAQAESEVIGGFQSASQVINLDDFELTVGSGDDAVTYSPQFSTLTSKTTFTRNERITMTLNGSDAQTFTVTTQTTAAQVAEAINAAVTAGTLTGLYASVSADDELQIDSSNAIQGVSASLDTPGYATFDADPAQTFESGDIISMTVTGGSAQTFTISSQDSASTVASAINAAVTAGTLSGVYASVVSDELRISSTDPTKGVVASIDQGGTVTSATVAAQASSTADLTSTGVVSEVFTVANLASSINALGVNLQAAVVQSGTGQYALSVSSTQTGALNTLSLRGIESPNAQLDRLTLSGTYEEDDVITVTVNGVDFSYTVLASDLESGGSAVAGNSDEAYQNIATGIAALFSSHADITTTASAGTVDFQAKVEGVAYTISLESETDTTISNLVANVEELGVSLDPAVTVTQPKKSGLASVTIGVVFDGVAWQVEHLPGMPTNCVATLEDDILTISSEAYTGWAGAEMQIDGVLGVPKAGDRIAVTLDSLGDAVGSPVLMEHASIELQSARDAFLSINGLMLQRSSNTIDDVVSGVTFNLNSPTEPAAGAIDTLADADFSSGTTNATVNVTAGAQDLSSEAVTDFVTAYNDLISFYKTETVASTDPASRGVLNGDSNVRSFMDRLRMLYVQGIRLADGSNISFSSIGVEFQRDGTLYLDTGALNTAVSNGLQDKLAAGVTLGYESSTSNFTSFLTASLRTTGLISTHISDVEAQQTRIEERISDWEDKLARIEQRYYRQYAALDALLFRLQTTSNALASAIDSLVNSQKN